MKVARVINSPNDHTKLQDDINALLHWSIQNKMKFHPRKCKVLTSTLKKTPSQYVYYMSDSPLDKSKAEKDLGIIVSDNFNWNKHQNLILGKAKQKLGLLRRSCSFSKVIQSRKVLYLAIVRSQFEHCSQVWRPTNATQTNKFKSVQRRGIKWVFGEDFNRYSEKEYLDKLKTLNILPIDLNFDLNDLILFRHIVFGTSFIGKPEYLLKNDNTNDTNDTYFSRQTRHFNDSDKLKFKCKITPKVGAFSNSFFHRTYLKWNSLPKSIREAESPDAFKTKLKQHLWIIAEELLSSN